MFHLLTFISAISTSMEFTSSSISTTTGISSSSCFCKNVSFGGITSGDLDSGSRLSEFCFSVYNKLFANAREPSALGLLLVARWLLLKL